VGSMALIKCKECGKQVSDEAKQCMGCGISLSTNKQNNYDNDGSGQATAALVLGILSLVVPFLGVILAIIGLVMANKAKKAGCTNGLRTAGFVLSIITLSLYLVMMLFLIITSGLFFKRVTNIPKPNDNSPIIQPGRLDITFDGGNEIVLDNVKSGSTESKNFTITNTSSATMYYIIKWNNVSNTYNNKDRYVYEIKGSNNKLETILPSRDDTIFSKIEIKGNAEHTYTITWTVKDLSDISVNNNETFVGWIRIEIQ